MKKIFLIAVTLLSSFFLSCGFNSSEDRGYGNVSFSISSELVRKVFDKSKGSSRQTGVNTADGFLLTAEIKGSGGYTDNSSFSISKEDFLKFYNDKTDFPVGESSFNDIPASEIYSIYVDVYETLDDEKIKIFTGGAEGVKVTAGGSSVVEIQLSSDTKIQFGTKIILYSKIQEPPTYGLYAFNKYFLNNGRKTTPDSTYSTGSEFYDFVVTQNDDVYYADSANLYKNGNVVASFSALDNLEDIYEVMLYAAGELIFIHITAGNQDVQNFCIFDGDKLGPLSPYPSYFNDFAVSLEAAAQGNAYSGFLYTSTNSSIEFSKIPFEYKDEGAGYFLEISSDSETILLSDKTESAYVQNLYMMAEISDMIFQNGYLYALINEQNYSIPTLDWQTSETTESYYSRGALIKIDISNFTASGLSIIGDSSMLTPTVFTGLFINGSTELTITLNVYQPKDNFFGPKKFIAIKPKELVISDDGVFLYKDGDAYKYKNINKVIVFSEENNVATGYDIAADIYFDREQISDMVFQKNTGTATPDPKTYLTFTKAD